VALGYVVDFIDFRLINFAVFNGADAFVCVGAGFMILFLVLDIVKEAKEGKK
jgi:lipoprotein signal peptidase